ncbi:hypothetical protein [Rhodococcus xishaensis]|nr:hypothetical protein [Rhodococcus xishaensis]
MSFLSPLIRSWRRAVICLVLLTGLLTMHGLANAATNTAGGTNVCPGASTVLPIPGPDSSSGTALPKKAAVDSETAYLEKEHPSTSPRSISQGAGPATAMEMSGESCVATLPRQAAAVSPLMLGFLVLVALGASAESAKGQARTHPETRRGPPSSGVDVLRLKCVLRT